MDPASTARRRRRSGTGSGAAAGGPAVVYLVEDGSRTGEVEAAAGVGEGFGFVAAGNAELVLAELDALQRLIARCADRTVRAEAHVSPAQHWQFESVQGGVAAYVHACGRR
jgi:hypothetical protein